MAKECFEASNNKTCGNYFEKHLIENMYRFTKTIPLSKPCQIIIAPNKLKKFTMIGWHIMMESFKNIKIGINNIDLLVTGLC